MGLGERYEFGEFVLEAAQRRLTRDGAPVPLAPKAYDVLLALVRRAGKLVTKRELLDLVWPQAFVEEGILAVHVSALRRALGGHSPVIETVARSGYRFVGQVKDRSAAHPGPEIEALLNRGYAHLRAASMYEVPKAVGVFQSAVALNPMCAAAHAGLALAHCAQAHWRLAPPSAAYADAKAAALRALATDPSCSAAQTALGAVLLFSEWNWPAAERSLQRAIQADARQAEAYLLYGQLLEALGKLEQGLAMKRKALALEPGSASARLSVSISYWNQRLYDDSVEWANQALEIDPAHPHAREHLAAAYLKKGGFDRWIAENIAHAHSHGVPLTALESLKNAYAGGGRAGVARLVLAHAAGQPEAFPAAQLAINYGELGELDAAFQHLERAIESRDPCLVHLAVAPQWDCLRADTRFLHCLARMGLTPVRQAAT
jgi:DNA-binding winged helix-turn-helix (wHTH) protein